MKIKKSTIEDIFLCLILVLPFYKSEFLIVTIPFMSKLYLALELMSLLYCLIIMIKNKYISKIILYILLYFLILLVPTILYNFSNLENYVKLLIPTLGLSIVFDYGLKYKTKSFLISNKILLLLLLIINFITIIIYPNGMYIGVGSGYADNWFLGYRNNHILYVLPYVIISITLSIFSKDKISKMAMIDTVFGLVSLIIARSSTSIVGLFLLLLYIALEKYISKNSLLNIKNYIITYTILFFSIIIFRIQYLFKFLIVDILGKDITFTNRVYIWDYVLKFIKSKPILGYGYELGEKRYLKTELYRSYHAHNQILEIIYKSGFVGFMFFILIFIDIFKKIYKLKETKIASFFSFSVFTLLIMMLTEAYSFEYFIYLLVLFNHVDILVKKERRV